jgi:hypothetical protein
LDNKTKIFVSFFTFFLHENIVTNK